MAGSLLSSADSRKLPKSSDDFSGTSLPQFGLPFSSTWNLKSRGLANAPLASPGCQKEGCQVRQHPQCDKDSALFFLTPSSTSQMGTKGLGYLLEKRLNTCRHFQRPLFLLVPHFSQVDMPGLLTPTRCWCMAEGHLLLPNYSTFQSCVSTPDWKVTSQKCFIPHLNIGRGAEKCPGRLSSSPQHSS